MEPEDPTCFMFITCIWGLKFLSEVEEEEAAIRVKTAFGVRLMVDRCIDFETMDCVL